VGVPAASVAADDGKESSRDLEIAREKIAGLEAAMKNLEALAAKEKAVAAQLTASCEALKAEVAQLRAQLILAQADRDKAFKSLVETTDAMQKVRAENQKLFAENKKLRALAEQAGVLPKDSDTPSPPAEQGVPSAAVQGVVVEVQDGGSVVISIGSDDGLKIGNRLHVYRSLGDHGIYVGQIEIVQAKPDTATCKIVGLQDTVRKGDRIVTRL
jgi:hypothetical protein